MTTSELKGYMKERLDAQDKVLEKQDRVLATLIKKIDPIVEKQAKTDGVLSTLKWVVGVGIAGLAVVITLLEILNKP